METKYYKPTIEESKDFLTYKAIIEDFAYTVTEFYKKDVPIEVLYPNKYVDGEIERSKIWWNKTNTEDLIVLEREKQAFENFYNKELKEIKLAIQYNTNIF